VAGPRGNRMNTLVIASILFGVTALGGATLLALRLRGGNPPLGLAMVHGLVAAASLVTLVLAVVGGARGPAVVALVLFGVAALGGFFLMSLHLRQRLLPVGVIFVHGTVALAGYVALLVAAFG
jgi:hypothetical protein